jgi:hypothetical protein
MNTEAKIIVIGTTIAFAVAEASHALKPHAHQDREYVHPASQHEIVVSGVPNPDWSRFPAVTVAGEGPRFRR